ncbi:hypothetical protein WICPIJ_002913 [Wickerhamomyces pijperi]|uniref:Protein kinase domain-containing protein n=1 Tax=Wickerhamomyces pijperi TaxID=599730 RepID=A0A9P8Q8S6_WICPI|nr:hypothetical protein WICPIJ_002913 [Wickerhamomyces pijperi]
MKSHGTSTSSFYKGKNQNFETYDAINYSNGSIGGSATSLSNDESDLESSFNSELLQSTPEPTSTKENFQLKEKQWYEHYDFLEQIIHNGPCQILFERSHRNLYEPEHFERIKGTLLEWPSNYKEVNYEYRKKGHVITKSVEFWWDDMEKYLGVDDIQFILNTPCHENLAQVYDIFVSDSVTLVIVSERLTSGLGFFITHHRVFKIKIPMTLIRSILKDILNGLKHIHNNGFYLGGLCIDSVLISDNEEYYTRSYRERNNISISGVKVKLADFGTAKRINGNDYKNLVFRNRFYMAPELKNRKENYSGALDIWSFGCIAYELLTFEKLVSLDGESDKLFDLPPFTDVQASEIEKKLSELKNDDMGLLEVLKCSLEPDPEKRATSTQLLNKGFFQ